MTFVGATPSQVLSVEGTATGGKNKKTTEESLSRALRFALTPSMISEDDFIRSILNYGATAATAETNTNLVPPTLTLYQYGLTPLQANQYLNTLDLPLGVSVVVSSLDTLSLDIELDLTVEPNSNTEDIVANLVANLRALHEITTPVIRITKLGFLGSVPGVTDVTYTSINNDVNDYLIPANTVTVVNQITLRLFDGLSTVEKVVNNPYS